eukprot:TRINITY_DN32595_c0_g1_i1.p1 TRINITY_DN32595_c0_g1~~TRINITY_DN32595_c0_g1_i1.p1  ORF type:complete len:519 (+),score=102.71 TRINITY_DN32595_c0_g1_i1:36-1592(+)
MSVPPLVRCTGVKSPHAKAINGVYEYFGAHGGRPCYRQTGVSSGNYLWYSEDCLEGAMWVITPKEAGVGSQPEGAIARAPNLGRWPWEVQDWQVCGKNDVFLDQPTMSFGLILPAAELIVQAPAMNGVPAACGFRRAGFVHGKVAFMRAGDSDDAKTASLRIFWMPKMARWLLASVKPKVTGVETVIARSVPDDGSTWASLWPWEVEAEGWESPTADTVGLIDGDAQWIPNRDIMVRLSSPSIVIGSVENWSAPPSVICGYYEPRGMANGRVYYVMLPDDISLENTTGPMCLWFAEDRGQWVVTAPEFLGDSSGVLARIQSRAWWPWEAHLGSTTCAAALGAAPFAAMPPWHGGAALLAGARSNWEVADDTEGFREARNMVVEIDCATQAHVIVSEFGSHPFAGVYERCGLVASRPFFMQTKDSAEDTQGINPKDPGSPDPMRFVLWYAEENEQWVLTEEFRLLDELVINARTQDSAWLPWQASTPWEVSDGDRGYVKDTMIRVEEVLPSPPDSPGPL